MDASRISRGGVRLSVWYIPPWNIKSIRKIVLAAFIALLVPTPAGLIVDSGMGEGNNAAAFESADEPTWEDPFLPAFCMNSSVMNQLLQGFGSRILFDESSDINLVCGSRVIREELLDNRLILEVELECTCVSEKGECLDIHQMEGNWVITFNY